MLWSPLVDLMVGAASGGASLAALGIAGYTVYTGGKQARIYVNRLLLRRQSWRDMCQHVRIMGMQGAGKSTLIQHLVVEQYKAGRGVFILDPHGKLAKECLRLVPRERMAQVVYHAPAVAPLGMNVLQMVRPGDEQERATVVDRFVGLLAGLVLSRWGDVQADALDQALWAALANPKATIADVIDLVADNGLAARLRMLIRNPVLQTMLSLPPVPFEQLMVSGGIYILDLAELEKKTADFIYALHVLRIQAAAKGRNEHSKGALLVMDECQRVASNADEIADMLAELRKYSIAVCLAHHAEVQMGDKLTKYYGLVGSQYLFRLTTDNAKHAQEIIAPIEPAYVTRLPNYHCVRRRQVGGWPETPRVVKTQAPPKPVLKVEEAQEIAKRSAERYGAADGTRRKAADIPRTTQSSDNEPVAEVFHRVRVLQETNAAPSRGRVSKRLPPADGQGIAENVGDSVLPY